MHRKAAAAAPQNPPMPPAGWVFMPQAQVTPAITARAEAILYDSTSYPGPPAVTDPNLFFHDVETIDGKELLFYVFWHAPDAPVGPNVWHRGVSVFVPASAPAPGPTAYVEGIDLSHYQGTPDWTQIAVTAAKRFAFIRASDGVSVVDASFAYNWTSAKAKGVLRGAYQFFRPTASVDAQVAVLLAKLGSDPGELPPALDLETNDGASPAAVAAAAKGWLVQVTSKLAPALAGRKPLVYTSPSFFAQFGADDAKQIAQLADLWIANWQVSRPTIPTAWSARGAVFWQYSATASVAGIYGNMDADRFFGSADALAAYARASSPPTPTLPPAPPFSFDLASAKGAQAALNALGYQPPLVVDGIVGPKTTAAIASFRAAVKGGPLDS